MISNDDINRFIAWKTAYWKEVAAYLEGPLGQYLNEVAPDIYQKSGTMLIFPAKDGLVGATFKKDFSFNDPRFDGWLRKQPGSVPAFNQVNCNLSDSLSYRDWVQLLSGNGLKIVEEGRPPPNNKVLDPRTIFPPFPPPPCPLPPLIVKNLNEFGVTFREITFTDIASNEIFSPFLWTELDIYSIGSLKKLSNASAASLARSEILSHLSSRAMGLKKEEISAQPTEKIVTLSDKVVTLLEQTKAQFEDLLNNPTNEEALQVFLKDNPVILSPYYLNCVPKPALGAEFHPDFIIEESSSECILVEIEPANLKLFTQSGEVTAPFTHAMGQIRNWRIWLRDNIAYAKQSLPFKNLHSESKAILIAGRQESIAPENQRKFAQLTLESNHQTEIITYDGLLARFASLIENLKNHRA